MMLWLVRKEAADRGDRSQHIKALFIGSQTDLTCNKKNRINANNLAASTTENQENASTSAAQPTAMRGQDKHASQEMTAHNQ